jgi:hypothetical protein
VRALADGRERTIAAAMAAGGAAWVSAGTWQTTLLQPGVAVPALLMLGVVAALAPDPGLASRRRALGLNDPGEPVRVLALVAGVLALAALALSVVLPARAELKARAALTLPAGATEDRQQAAALDAAIASQLDPLSSQGPVSEATVAIRRGRFTQARQFALEAVNRTPDSAAAWIVLAEVARAQADRAGFTIAADRALALDPLGARARELATEAAAFEAPPNGSPTATGTPLTPSPDGVPFTPTPDTGADGGQSIPPLDDTTTPDAGADGTVEPPTAAELLERLQR